MFRSEEQRPNEVQFSMRIAVLGGIALVIFAAVFFRLWYLEVLSGDDYLAESRGNQVRSIPVQAARGEILDANGNVLVANQTAVSLQVRPEELPSNVAAKARELRELAKVSGIKYKRIRRKIREQKKILPANPVTLKSDVDRDLVYYVEERKDQFPGVTAGEVSVRRYPKGTMAAHLFGYVSEVSAEDLEQPQYQDLDPGDRVGRDGLEQQYDSDLRGRNGSLRVQVDAMGTPQSSQPTEVPPVTGNNLVLSIDSKVQKAAESAMKVTGKPGAFVAMNVDDGSIIAMGSYPTFDPSLFTPPVSSSKYSALRNDEAAPLANRAITGLYPTGSTFKPITAISAMSEGVLGATETITDDGSYDLGDGNEIKNADDGAYGTISVQQALQYSSNVFFATVGARLEDETKEGFQKWASDLGIGQTTGVDLPGEAQGLLPTPEWRNELYKEGLTDREWSVGDNINLALGQGDLQADPVQMAVAYSAIANGGSVVRPHLASSVQDAAGRTISEFSPAPQRKLDIPADARSAVLAGMHDAATAVGGTSVQIFGDFPVEVAGKTGTAERPPNGFQSWYASVAPYPDPEIAVVVTVENGGYGAESAAPIAKSIYSAYFAKEVKAAGGTDTEQTTTDPTTGEQVPLADTPIQQAPVAPTPDAAETAVPAG